MNEESDLINESDKLEQLFEGIRVAFQDVQPTNVPEFVVQFMFTHYPEHLAQAPKLINCDVHLLRDRDVIRAFFVHNKLGAAVANPVLNAGYDTLDALALLRADAIAEIERLNDLVFLPGHRQRLEVLAGDMQMYIRAFLHSQRYNNPITSFNSLPFRTPEMNAWGHAVNDPNYFHSFHNQRQQTRWKDIEF